MDRWIYSSCNNTAPTTPWSARYQVLFALGVLAAVKIHVGWFCDLEDMIWWICAMRNRCHWFQVQRIQRDIMEWSAHQIITHGCWIWPLVLTINFSFLVRNYGSFWVCWKLEICRCSLLSRSNLDWVGERGDLQGLNIASTPAFLDWTFHYYSFGNSRCTPCAHNDGLWYVRGVSKMCRCAGQQLILDDYYNDSYSFIMYHIRIQIHQHLSKDTLLDAVHGVLSFWSYSNEGKRCGKSITLEP